MIWLEQTETDWSAWCDCSGEAHALGRVEGAARGLWSWHLRHALGGYVMHCSLCGERAAIGGSVAVGRGELDLLALSELERIPHRSLTPLQVRLIVLSLVAEDMLAARAKGVARELLRGGEREAAVIAAQLLRARAQHEKLLAFREVFREHGLRVDARLRVARTSEGAGVIYMADRSPLPLARETAEQVFASMLDELGTGRVASVEVQEETVYAEDRMHAGRAVAGEGAQR